MNKRVLVATVALCALALSGTANAMCPSGVSAQNCAPVFGNGTPDQLDGAANGQGFDAQGGNQWAKTNGQFGNFRFYSGLSTGNAWGADRSAFGSPLRDGRGADLQGRSDPSLCALYGTCR